MLFPEVAPKRDPSCSRLPLEIWQKIFLLVSSSEKVPILAEADPVFWSPPESASSTSLILPRSPTILSSVSSSWRHCAHGMPDLWNILFVKVPKSMKHDDDTETPPQILELVKARLSLSQSMPLKICIVSKSNPSFGRSITHAILPFSRQWETIHLYTPTETYSEFQGLGPDDYPILSSFNILPQVYSRADPHDAFRLDQVPFFAERSSIRRFHTSLIPSPTSPLFQGLQEFHIRATRTETWCLAEILGLCTQLQVLTLSGYGITARANAPSIISQITLPKLETLILEHPPGREPLLDLLTLPKLKTLFLGGRSHWHTDAIFHVIDRLQERSQVESLERLWIYFEIHNMGPSTLVDTLRRNPALKELRINQGFTFFGADLISPDFFAALAGGKNEESSPESERAHSQLPMLLCPRLERLHLDTNSIAIFESKQFGNLLERRCLGGGTRCPRDLTPVVHVEISVRPGASKNLLRVYKEWKKKGYCVDVDVVD